jgi:hypothetical protein
MGTGGSLAGGKVWPERDADHSPPPSAEVKKEAGCISSPPKRLSWRVVFPLYYKHIMTLIIALQFVNYDGDVNWRVQYFHETTL